MASREGKGDETELSAVAEAGVLLRLAAPIALAQVGLVAITLVDTAVVGRRGVDDLAGVALGRSIAFAACALPMGVPWALEPLASQAVGAGEGATARGAYITSCRVGVAFAVVAALVALLLSLLLERVGVPPVVAQKTRAFLLGHGPSLPLLILFLAGKGFLQAHGRTGPGLAASVAANLVNIVVCSLLVGGDDTLAAVGLRPRGLPALGALGAGVASTVATAVLALWVVVAAGRAPAHGPKATAVSAGRVIALALPLGLQLLAEVGVFSAAAVAAGTFGAVATSAYQVVVGLVSFTFMGALGVGGATGVRVGHAVGAGRSPRRAGAVGLGVGALVMTFGAVAFAVVPRPLLLLFTKDEGVLTAGAPLLRIAALFQIFDGVQCVAASALRGAGDVRAPFLLMVTAYWLLAFPLALTLAHRGGLGPEGLWWGLTVGLVVAAVGLTARFFVLTRNAIARV